MDKVKMSKVIVCLCWKTKFHHFIPPNSAYCSSRTISRQWSLKLRKIENFKNRKFQILRVYHVLYMMKYQKSATLSGAVFNCLFIGVLVAGIGPFLKFDFFGDFRCLLLC